MGDDGVDLRGLSLGQEADMSQVDSEQRNLAGQHPFRAAQDRAVASQDHHQLNSVLERDWLVERRHRVRQPRVKCGYIIGGQSGDDAGRTQPLDQTGCRGDGGRPAHVGQHGDATRSNLGLRPLGWPLFWAGASVTCHSIFSV